jgi:hypothetical protein
MGKVALSGSEVITIDSATYQAVLYKHPSPDLSPYHLLVYKEQAHKLFFGCKVRHLIPYRPPRTSDLTGF